jgi:hypothetical protein
VREFTEMDREAKAELDSLSAVQVLRRFFTGK